MPETIDDAKSKQSMRLFDILVFSPILIYIGTRRSVTKQMQYILLLFALTTLIYNGYYLIKYREK